MEAILDFRSLGYNFGGRGYFSPHPPPTYYSKWPTTANLQGKQYGILQLTSAINSLPKVAPETISIRNVCRTIQNTIIKMAAGGHFEFWALTNSAHAFKEGHPR